MQSINDGRNLFVSHLSARPMVAFMTAVLLCVVFATETAARERHGKRVVSSGTGCTECGSKTKKSFKDVPCHSKNYVDPKVAKKFKTAVRDMKRAGISPTVTSAWRSTDKQAALFRCSQNRRCRKANPWLYRALPPGQSLHEAGFALDISGVAAGPRGAKKVTPRGHRIIGIMRKNGFQWRYGLKDPAHFEANPRRYGYRNAKQAISLSQNICDAKIATRKSGRSRQTAALTKRQTGVRPVSVTVKPRRHNSRA
ncbi:MAG: D-alanyl-D-alanine carboxypeptidase family protein [Blastocatellia bacterium]